MTSDEEIAYLQARKGVLESEMASISAQLDARRAEHHVDGVFADPRWWARAVAAKRFRGVEHQQVLRRLADLRRAAKVAACRPFAERFIDVARQRLSADQFTQILDESRGLADGGSHG